MIADFFKSQGNKFISFGDSGVYPKLNYYHFPDSWSIDASGLKLFFKPEILN
jgi:hypothetical protein